MTYLLARIAAVLVVLLSSSVGITRMLPYDDSAMRAFITDPMNCGGECILGIRPGSTTVSEAMQRLQAHRWVGDVELSASGNGYGQIRWLWNGNQPAVISAEYRGRLTFYWDADETNSPPLEDARIETISIDTEIRMYLLQQWYGMPDSGTASIRPDGAVGYSAAFHMRGSTISLSAVMSCPISLISYWNARAKLSIGIGSGTSAYVPPVDMAALC